MNKFFKMSTLALFVALSFYAPANAGGQNDIELPSYEVLSTSTIIEGFFFQLKKKPLTEDIQHFPVLCGYMEYISSPHYELTDNSVLDYVSVFHAIHKSMESNFVDQPQTLIQHKESEIFLQTILAKMASKIINHKTNIGLFSDQVKFLEKVLLYPFYDKETRKSAADWFDALSADSRHQDDWKKEMRQDVARKFNFLQVLNPAKFSID